MMRAGSGSWERRIQRAERLANEGGPAAPLLVFYARLLRHQQTLYESFERRRPSESIDADVKLIADSGSLLLRAVADAGPESLAIEARRLLESDRVELEQQLLEYWRGRSDRLFFSKALFQPYAQWHADAGAALVVNTVQADNRCPRCGGAPQLSMLDASSAATGDGSGRHLLCATCLSTWPFRRVVCPSCGEEDDRKLPYYRAPELEHLRVDACDGCGRYLKTIDLGRLGLAVPLVDEIAGAPLDLWAREHGYEKVELNLVGL